ncbi:nose resistant to fluoxetine protein 6-like [Helicoverpa zea]|uniref:nose resistant to fluoxetine protein 6-like n=1 Tax=Helicoverpa zea TaxID=7113 RepID=UPI001F57B089|nr:nose resistant to fluoxetine protein 6-like [Helicoverpa zea]
MVYKELLFLFLCLVSIVHSSNGVERSIEALDNKLYEDVLDAEECHRQIRYIRSNALLLLQFMDAGLRTPRGILTGNTIDMGNYHQCIAINHTIAEEDNMHIQGKYASIFVPLNQSFHWPRPRDTVSTQFDPTTLYLDPELAKKIEEYNIMRRELLMFSGIFEKDDRYHLQYEDERSGPANPLIRMSFRLALCTPKPCTIEQAITSFFFNVTAIGFRYEDDYTRIADDKPWSGADTAAVVVFSVLGFLTLISTSYDLCYRFVFKKDPKQMSTLGRSFSVYTNGQRLTTFSTTAGSMQCLDGIRTLAMVWVVVGHSYSTEPFQANPLDATNWMFSARGLWITAATMTVDTFFTIAGILLVYTTVNKMNQVTFMKNIHWFYLNRFVRLTPLLAVTALLAASYFNRFTDGPFWLTVATITNHCRNNWWSTLLHVQNFVHVEEMCVPHSWYVAIDFQLYVVSPLVLIWVLSGKKIYSWIGLIGSFAAVLVASTIYNFHHNLPGHNVVPTRIAEMTDYMTKYYFNTLCRAGPFFVGMIFGYVLHLYRKTRIQIPWILALFFWACSAGIIGSIFYFVYRVMQFDWDNEFMENFMNSFMRPAYACAISWLVIACVHGYAGPINWFLSLEAWRLPARLSYGVFLFHYPLQFSLNATMVTPIYFSVGGFAFKFLSYLTYSFIWSFVLTLLVDSPITVLFKMLMDLGKPNKPAVKPNEVTKQDNDEKNPNVNDNQRSLKELEMNKEDDANTNDTKEVEVLSAGLNEPLEKRNKEGTSNDTQDTSEASSSDSNNTDAIVNTTDDNETKKEIV